MQVGVIPAGLLLFLGNGVITPTTAERAIPDEEKENIPRLTVQRDWRWC